MAITTAIVPIAGWGARMLPISLVTAKEFLPLGHKPAIQHIAEELAYAGITKIVFVSSGRKKSVANLFEYNEKILAQLSGSKEYLKKQLWPRSMFANITFEIAIQEEQLGLGHAVLCAEEHVSNEPFVVALGDCLIGLPGQAHVLQTMIQNYVDQSAEVAISFEAVAESQVHKYGIARPRNVGSVFELEDLVEKPSAAEAPSNLAICGRYILSPEIFQALRRLEPGQGGEIQLTDAIRSQLSIGRKAIGVTLPSGIKRYDLGDIKTYVGAFIEFAMASEDLRPFVEAAIQNSDFEIKS